ncbi:phosphatidate phosphatase App1 family protein [Deinococcus sp. PESE-13]
MTLRRTALTFAALALLPASASAAQLTLLAHPQPGRVEVRVAEDDPWGQRPARIEDNAAVNVLRTFSQLLPNPLAGVPVRCTPQRGEAVNTRTDNRGHAACTLPPGAGAVRVEVPGAGAQTAPDWQLNRATHLTVTDLDDTVIVTGVRQGGAARVLRQNALTRPVFPGVQALLQAEAARGPMVYLSNSPEGLGAPLQELLGTRGFPAGPLLLRDFPSVSGAQHKGQALDTLARQTGATFTLLGDSGERDPEIYAAFVRAWPGRVERILIRDVVSGERHAEVERLLGGLGVAWEWLPGAQP